MKFDLKMIRSNLFLLFRLEYKNIITKNMTRQHFPPFSSLFFPKKETESLGFFFNIFFDFIQTCL